LPVLGSTVVVGEEIDCSAAAAADNDRRRPSNLLAEPLDIVVNDGDVGEIVSLLLAAASAALLEVFTGCIIRI
jgi:hypothetical protein